MTNLVEIINLANELSETLDKAAQNEKKFCADVCLELERYSWETYRLANNVRELKECYGG